MLCRAGSVPPARDLCQLSLYWKKAHRSAKGILRRGIQTASRKQQSPASNSKGIKENRIMSRQRSRADQQRQDAIDVFNIFDKKGDGKIDPQQIGEVCRALGLNPPQAAVSRMVERVDDERNGARLSYTDFQPIYAALAKERDTGTSSDFVEGLRMFDADGSGYISVTELRHLLTNIGDKMSNADVDRLLKEVRTDNDQVNYEEFVRLVMSQ